MSRRLDWVEGDGLLERAVGRYLNGASLRDATADMPFSREVLLLELVNRDQIRERLAYIPDPHTRVMSYVNKADGCWLWTGLVNNHGYGIATIDGRQTSAHRVVYGLLVKPVPKGLDLCHKCDNPLCVRPDHMFVGTRKENMQDAARKGRTCKGSAAPNAILNEDMVRIARKRAAAGEPIRKIARELSAPYKVLWQAVRGKSWRHV